MEIINNNEAIIDGKRYKLTPVEEEISADTFGDCLVVTKNNDLYFQDLVGKMFFLFEKDQTHIYRGYYRRCKSSYGDGFSGLIPENLKGGKIVTMGGKHLQTPIKKIKVTETTFGNLKPCDKFFVCPLGISKETIIDINNYRMKISDLSCMWGSSEGQVCRNKIDEFSTVYKFEVV